MKYIKNYNTIIKMNDRKFQEILNFYLFECPTPNKSMRSKTFADYGWIGKTKFSTLKKSMLAVASTSLKKIITLVKKKN